MQANIKTGNTKNVNFTLLNHKILNYEQNTQCNLNNSIQHKRYLLLLCAIICMYYNRYSWRLTIDCRSSRSRALSYTTNTRRVLTSTEATVGREVPSTCARVKCNHSESWTSQATFPTKLWWKMKWFNDHTFRQIKLGNMIQAPFDKYKVGFKRLTTTNMV